MSKSTFLSNYLTTITNYEGAVLLPISYAILIIISIWIGRIITKFVHIAFLSVENRTINHTMGAFFGMAKGVIILIILYGLSHTYQKWTNKIKKTQNL